MTTDNIDKALENQGIFKFKRGELEMISITDGSAKFSPIQPFFAPKINAKELNNLLNEYSLSIDAIEIGLNILLIKINKQIVLFDAGCGQDLGPDSGKLTEGLHLAGIHPSEVTAILLTHGHPDHIGGLTDENGQLTYANAKIYISKTEYDFWMSSEPDFSKSNADEGFIDLMIAVATKNLAVAGEKLQFFNDGDMLFDSIKVEIIPGHTPGHTLFHIFTDEGEFTHMADITHDTTLLLHNPEWGVALDTDFTMAGIARRDALLEMATNRKAVFSSHLPWPGIGKVNLNGKNFEWIPEIFERPKQH